jgi:hypothetical protein
VLYAEGPGEYGGEIRLLPAPTHELADEHLGPGHVLVRRIVAMEANCPIEAVRFVAPLRLRGRSVRGSDLLVPATLRKLVAFPPTVRRPDLAVILLDEDGDKGRAGLAAELHGTVVPAILGVAVPEFEAWLLADHACLNSTLGVSVSAPPSAEALARGGAKTLLGQLMTSAGVASGRINSIRCQLAENCSLHLLRGFVSAERFIKELRRQLRRNASP